MGRTCRWTGRSACRDCHDAHTGRPKPARALPLPHAAPVVADHRNPPVNALDVQSRSDAESLTLTPPLSGTEQLNPPYVLSRYPVLNIHHAVARHRPRKPRVAARLTPTCTSATP